MTSQEGVLYTTNCISYELGDRSHAWSCLDVTLYLNSIRNVWGTETDKKIMVENLLIVENLLCYHGSDILTSDEFFWNLVG